MDSILKRLKELVSYDILDADGGYIIPDTEAGRDATKELLEIVANMKCEAT